MFVISILKSPNNTITPEEYLRNLSIGHYENVAIVFLTK